MDAAAHRTSIEQPCKQLSPSTLLQKQVPARTPQFPSAPQNRSFRQSIPRTTYLLPKEPDKTTAHPHPPLLQPHSPLKIPYTAPHLGPHTIAKCFAILTRAANTARMRTILLCSRSRHTRQRARLQPMTASHRQHVQLGCEPCHTVSHHPPHRLPHSIHTHFPAL